MTLGTRRFCIEDPRPQDEPLWLLKTLLLLRLSFILRHGSVRIRNRQNHSRMCDTFHDLPLPGDLEGKLTCDDIRNG